MMTSLLLFVLGTTEYYIIASILSLLVLLGIYLMSRVKTARLGNLLSGLAILFGVVLTIVKYDLLDLWQIYIFMGIGVMVGLLLAYKVKMIEMPEMIALLNALGGLASAIVGGYALFSIGSDGSTFSMIAANIAVQIGVFTFVGSIIASFKLHRIMSQKQITFPKHKVILFIILMLMIMMVILPQFITINTLYIVLILMVLSGSFGLFFSIKIGGADMPIAIALLNSFSGIAGAISGLAINDLLLVSIGGIVGASGLLLTQMMCRAMNRRLFDILLGGKITKTIKQVEEVMIIENDDACEKDDPISIIQQAKDIIIVPGYGMAIAQAQHLVMDLTDHLKDGGARVRFAVHPVAGRMPGHMNVLLAEAGVDYDDIYDIDDINEAFIDTDLVIVVGANDVLNPAARTEEGTPIYGMPILDVDQSKHIFIFNYDTKPGYSGVDNPLYERNKGMTLFLGNAKETLDVFLKQIKP